MQLALEDGAPALLSGALEHVGLPIFVCNEAGQVKGRTSEAEALLSTGRFRLLDGRIALPHPREDAALIHALVRVQRQPVGLETLMLRGDGKQMPIVADICRLPAHPLRMNSGAQILIIIRSGRRWHNAAPTILRAGFGLSAAEAAVALALARGETRDEIAAARGTSAQTVKAQLKSIFAKLGVSREAELVSLFGEMLRI